jgi:hypothetical protein
LSWEFEKGNFTDKYVFLGEEEFTDGKICEVPPEGEIKQVIPIRSAQRKRKKA